MSDQMKKDIMSQKLDEAELETVTGGGSADGPGYCDANYYAEHCWATVEKGSDCWGTDYCTIYHENYTQPGGCYEQHRSDWDQAHWESV